MRWQDLKRSGRIEDRRGMRLAGPVGGAGLLIVVVVSLLTGINPLDLLQDQSGAADPSATEGIPGGGGNDPRRDFVAAVLGSTEGVWSEVFQSGGEQYREPTLVLYDGMTQSSCGMGQAAMGPFYCSADERVYLDLSFFQDLDTRFEAPGDFAQAYVIAHEVGHHVQHLLGTAEPVQSQRTRQSEVEANALSVRFELQADCYAGIWGKRAELGQRILEPGDLEEALNAASAIGDDRLQRRTEGTVVPESFTHGTSAQRASWFRKGFTTGNPADCDTFSGGGSGSI